MDLSLAKLASSSAQNTPLIVVVTQSSFLLSVGKDKVSGRLQNSLSFLFLWAALALPLNTFACQSLPWKEVAQNVLPVEQSSRVNYLFGISRYLGGGRELFLNCSLCQSGLTCLLRRGQGGASVWLWAQADSPCWEQGVPAQAQGLLSWKSVSLLYPALYSWCLGSGCSNRLWGGSCFHPASFHPGLSRTPSLVIVQM